MKKQTTWFWLIVLFFVMWLVGMSAHAATPCSAIKNADERAYCRAVQMNMYGQCSAINDYDLRQRCVARVTGRTNSCSTVSSIWEREQCKDAARSKR